MCVFPVSWHLNDKKRDFLWLVRGFFVLLSAKDTTIPDQATTSRWHLWDCCIFLYSRFPRVFCFFNRSLTYWKSTGKMGRKSIESAVQLRPVGRNRTRPKYYYCVCRCTPDYGVTNMDTHLLDWTVSRGFHAVCCAKIPRMKAWKGMRLGDLCYEAGFPLRALRIWERTLHQILDAD